jgi:adenylylsulfate kinase-like enzyme
MKTAEFAALVLAHVGTPEGRPAVLAVDGRSASGKSTLAGRLAAEIPGAEPRHRRVA